MPGRAGDAAAPRAVVFDFDGLLVDSETACYLVADRSVGPGRSLGRADYASWVGRSPAEFWDWLRVAFSLDRTLDEMLELKHSELMAFYEAPEWTPGALELIAAASVADMKLAVASSSPRHFIEASLDAAGVRALFAAVVSVDDDDVARPKPAPDVYLAACARIGVPPEDAVALEDSAPGAEAAVAAGLVTYFVPSEWTADQETPAGARRAENLTEITSLLVSRRLTTRFERRVDP
jgi:HAD superfamily hydrolase (TIGR01509 family)